jgi:hypothetical protein
VLLNRRANDRQVDPLMHADEIIRKIGGQRLAAGRARGGAMLDDLIRIRGQCPLWPSCPGLAPPGRDFSRRTLRSLDGGLDEMREVFSGRCRRSTS